jgi:hypothetical protein
MKILDMTALDWLTFFMGSGLVGAFVFKLKGAQAWAIFLLAWILVAVFIHRVLGVQTQAGYYLGISKNPRYPDINNGIVKL